MVIRPTSPIDASGTYSSEASINRQVFWSIFLIREIQRFHHPLHTQISQHRLNTAAMSIKHEAYI